MNKYVGMGLSFVGGLVLGGIAMKIYKDKKFKEEYQVIDEANAKELTEEEQIALSDADLIRDDEPVKPVTQARREFHEAREVESDLYNEALKDLQYKIDEQAETTTFTPVRGETYTNEPYFVTEDRSKPYLIAEEQYESEDDYDSDEYTLFADGYICNSLGEVVTDEENIIRLFGVGFEKYFDEVKSDMIIIRNEPLSMDFSIIRDIDNLRDICSPRVAHQMGWDVD